MVYIENYLLLFLQNAKINHDKSYKSNKPTRGALLTEEVFVYLSTTSQMGGFFYKIIEP